MNLSVIICTHNRAELLKRCIQSLENQVAEGIEIIIVDNNSADHTKDVVNCFQHIHSLQYIFEGSTGLSFARNNGLHTSKAGWIMYLDDDAICQQNTIAIATELIRTKADFGIIGGVFKPYYVTPKPHWLSENFGSNIPESNKFRMISKADEQLPTGGILLINKSTFSIIAPFDPLFGMKGNKTGYGEETDLIIRALQNNIKVGLSPDLRMSHLVAQNKYHIMWHIRSYYASKKSYFRIRRTSISAVLTYFARGNAATIIKRLPKLVSDKNYYWQNFVIEATYPFSYLFAYIFK